MGNKILIVISILLFLGLAGSAYYFFPAATKCKNTVQELTAELQKCEADTGQVQAQLEKCLVGKKEITEVYLEKFAAGIEIGPETKGTVATTFKKNNLIGISGEVSITGATGKAILSFKIFDEKGELAQEGGPGMEVKNGGFGMCCINPPTTVGKYTMKLFLDSQEAKTISFEVVP